MELVYIAVIQLQSLRDFPPAFIGQVSHFQNQLIHVSRATRSGAMISTRCTSKLSYSIAGRHEDSPHPRWEGCGWWGSVLCCYRSLAPPWAQWPAVMKIPSAAAIFESNNPTVFPVSVIAFKDGSFRGQRCCHLPKPINLSKPAYEVRTEKKKQAIIYRSIEAFE